jgi:catechol 2,3-dioxygenase-like lactoylglutathione lyase family enzyme
MIAYRVLVDDLPKAVAFYSDLLGLPMIEQWGPHFAMVGADGFQIWLSGPATSAAGRLSNGLQPEPGGWNRVVIMVDDLDATLSRLNLTPIAEPIRGPGGSQALVSDGVGNVVELFQSGKE